MDECVRCGKPIADEPVRDPEQVWWLGDKADTYCTADCLESASERYWMAVWTS